MNYVVKNDNPDVAFSVSVGEVRDAEGEVINDTELTFAIESSNPGAVEITVGEDGRSGNVHFGTSGQAAVVVNVTGPNGQLLGTGGDNFTVTTGDPASISGVTTSFEGLEPTEIE